jgi:hypothetical protein
VQREDVGDAGRRAFLLELDGDTGARLPPLGIEKITAPGVVRTAM